MTTLVRGALCEAGHPDLADFVIPYDSKRTLPCLNFSDGTQLSDDDLRLIRKAGLLFRSAHYKACAACWIAAFRGSRIYAEIECPHLDEWTVP